MIRTTFITGNANKAAFLSKWLGFELDHQKLELDELQSFDLHEIVEHKARQAYASIRGPVLVEDVALSFHALGNLPGPFIKWFLQELSYEQLCNLISEKNRGATSTVCYGWFNGTDMRFFDGSLTGKVAEKPRGTRGYGFDPVFIPNGSLRTHAEMTDSEIEIFGLRTTTVYPQLRNFFATLDKLAK